MGFLYKIVSKVNGRVYIGITTRSFEQRQSEHLKALSGGYHGNRRLQNHFNLHGESSLVFSIIQEISDRVELLDAEVNLIATLDSTNRNTGFNLTKGGELNLPSEETTAIRRANAKNQLVSQYTLEGKLLKTFTSSMEAERELGIDNSMICRACKKQILCYGHLYRKGNSPTIPAYVDFSLVAKYKPVDRYCGGQVVASYTSLKEAATVTGIPYASIQQACGNNGRAYGVEFRYANTPYIPTKQPHVRKTHILNPIFS